MYNYIFPTTYGWLGLCQMDRGVHTAREGGWRCAAELMVCWKWHQCCSAKGDLVSVLYVIFDPLYTGEQSSAAAGNCANVVTLGILGGLVAGIVFTLLVVGIVFGVMKFRRHGKVTKSAKEIKER